MNSVGNVPVVTDITSASLRSDLETQSEPSSVEQDYHDDSSVQTERSSVEQESHDDAENDPYHEDNWKGPWITREEAEAQMIESSKRYQDDDVDQGDESSSEGFDNELQHDSNSDDHSNGSLHDRFSEEEHNDGNSDGRDYESEDDRSEHDDYSDHDRSSSCGSPTSSQ